MITEDIIARVENAIEYDQTPKEILTFLERDYHLTGYNAYLAYQAGKVSLEMFKREYEVTD